MIFRHRTAEGDHLAKIEQPDRWLSIEEAAALLEADLDELLGREQITGNPLVVSDDPPPHPRHARVFTPGLRGDAA